MSDIAERLAALRGRISAACRESGRDDSEVELLAVSKTFPAEAVREAYDAGQRAFGESRQQEAAPKIEVLPPDIRWHFIGGLQRNKVRKVVAGFGCIHSVDSLRLAEYLDRVAGDEGKRPQIYLEVNVAGEESKGGFSSDELLSAAESLHEFRHIELLGLMAIPPEAGARGCFARTRELRDLLEARSGLRLPGLSMGMSGDYLTALEAGSNCVRIGSVIFE